MFFKEFFDAKDVHHMKTHLLFTCTRCRKMVCKEIIHKTRVIFLSFEDFTLVLLISSTIELPKFIFRQLFLFFLCTAWIAWTQKERERSCFLTASFSFCVKFILRIIHGTQTYAIVLYNNVFFLFSCIFVQISAKLYNHGAAYSHRCNKVIYTLIILLFFYEYDIFRCK